MKGLEVLDWLKIWYLGWPHLDLSIPLCPMITGSHGRTPLGGPRRKTVRTVLSRWGMPSQKQGDCFIVSQRVAWVIVEDGTVTRMLASVSLASRMQASNQDQHLSPKQLGKPHHSIKGTHLFLLLVHFYLSAPQRGSLTWIKLVEHLTNHHARLQPSKTTILSRTR